MFGAVTPVDCLKFSATKSVLYRAESLKKLSSALTRLRRSDFIAVMYAFDLVLANFGIAIAARMPMMTTTIKSSINVKPLRFITVSVGRGGKSRHSRRRGQVVVKQCQ